MMKPWLKRSRGFFLSNPHGASALGVSRSILWTILIGFIAGVLAKLITPGSNEPQGFILTTILGIVGAFVATYLGQALGWYRADEGAGLIGATVRAVIMLLVWAVRAAFPKHGVLAVWIVMITPDKSRKTAAELKLMIEEKLLAGHPDCERAEVVINPPAAGRPWSAAIFGVGPTIFECRRKLEGIVEQLRDQFDLLI